MTIGERRQRASELYAQGLPCSEVAEALGVGTMTVWRDLKAIGVTFRHSNEPQIKPRPCEVCGAEFRPSPKQVRNGFGRFCSRKCGGEAHRIHPKAEPRTCAREGCDVVFTPTGANVSMGWGKYCSKACSSSVTRNTDKGKLKSLKCDYCGLTFDRTESAIRDDFNVCSPECWGKYRWKHGIGIGEGVVGLGTPNSRRKWKGRWAGGDVKGAANAGRAAGTAKGGRPASSTPEQQAQMFELLNTGMSSRDVAAQVFGDSSLYKRVLRYANR
ncbi:MAG TPA: helix-turn-helix domain-containing protein [Gaiellaceae bacterium]|nr:helix-turn-helix domain-containing protein [Gaiellaceae bacterium]